jgi:hypothetical protein
MRLWDDEIEARRPAIESAARARRAADLTRSCQRAARRRRLGRGQGGTTCFTGSSIPRRFFPALRG